MTTTEDAASFTPSVRRQPVLLCLAVGAAVAAGWVAYRHYWSQDVDDRILRGSWFFDHFWAVTLVYVLVLCVPYALVLLLWGRGLRGAAAAAGVALATGVLFWAIDRVFQSYVWGSGPASRSSLRAYLWSELLVPALLVPLAWGLARRRGHAWWPGVLVGPVVAAVLRELQLRWSWWQERVTGPGHHYHWQLQAAVFVAPFVLAVLACWALEARSRPSPEIETPA
jgi:hypothetical protein